MEWINSHNSTNIPIDGSFLKEKAKAFAEKKNINIDLKTSNSWFEKFKSRLSLFLEILCGECFSRF